MIIQIYRRDFTDYFPFHKYIHNCRFTFFVPVTEEEFLILAEKLRPWTQRAMKIEVAPWIRDYVVEMQELYCQLTLEKIFYKAFGKKSIAIEHYQVFFEEHAQVPNKILAKGDPGIGKTTLAKKIAWDWAKGHFNKVSIVFIVFLKSVHPNDTLEKVIITQRPELKGLGITPEKLESLIEHFGKRCLLILDGLDELAIRSNIDVLSVIKHEKYLNCNVLVTCRPHSTRDIKEHFDTVVSVQGFTQIEARKFAFCVVRDDDIAWQILDFNPTGNQQEATLCNSPILLSFMCRLVIESAVDLTKKTMPTGEIYTRMVQCLYKQFTIRRGIRYNVNKFAEVVGVVGKLAWDTLLSNNALFEKSRVHREVGEDAFHYGFLIGDQDLIGDIIGDINITFLHRNIQEFFGTFFFVLLLNQGMVADCLQGADVKTPIFMVNPLVLHFCFWFLNDH